MGSENSALKSYTLQEPPFTLPSGLAVYPAVLQDGKFASVFVYKRENEDTVNKAAKGIAVKQCQVYPFLSVDKGGMPFSHWIDSFVSMLPSFPWEGNSNVEQYEQTGMRGALPVLVPRVLRKELRELKHLKTLRHPCLLRFLSCTVEADGIHLVTDRVRPLEVALHTLSSAEICAGIYDILLALIFLHDRGHLTHNNVCLSSVFVSDDGHWKLGGMETVCKVSQATPEFLKTIHPVRDPTSIPPEEMCPEFTTLPESHGHARDAYSFGILVESLLTILNEQVSADVLSSFQQTLHSALLNPIPKCRPALCTLLSHDFFRNDFLEVVNFLKSLTLKSEEEKTEFFKFLLDRVSCLSEELIASRLVPLLLNQLVFAEPVAVKSFLPHLLGPKKDDAQGETPCLLSPALFRSRVIPVLLQLFEVHEEHVRMVLLSHIEAYVEHFTQEQLKKVILPQVLLGLRDTSDSIVAITLHSLAVLVSLLGPEVVVGGERTKIFKRTAPSFTKTIDLCPEGDQLSMNGISDVKNAPEDSDNCPSDSKKSEEWPDWSEPEDPTVGIQMWPGEAHDGAGSQCPGVAVESPCASSSGDVESNPGVGISAPGLVSPGGHSPVPASLSLTEESKHQKSSLLQQTSLVPSGGDPKQMQLPRVLSQERPLRVPSELGLGEEFTIQVKKKPVLDPEVDWFADMTPDIKPSAALLISPELRTAMMVPDKDDASPVSQFSSKFAAAEMTEGEAEGWGEEGELNWEDNNW